MARFRADGAPAKELRAEPLGGERLLLQPYAPANKDEVRAALDGDPDAWSLVATSDEGARFEGS